MKNDVYDYENDVYDYDENDFDFNTIFFKIDEYDYVEKYYRNRYKV